MEMTKIRKDSLGAVEQINEELSALASRAQELLGYNPLSELVNKDRSLELTPLQIALRDLDIEVLRASDVQLYMVERQMEHTRELFAAWESEFLKEGAVGQWKRFGGPAWLRQDIAKYNQPIPEFVLAKAVQIKQAYPECTVWVHSLQDHPDPFLSVGLPDAQYEWMEPREQYFVEVWAEPKFEGRV